FWGDGRRSLILSDVASPYPYFRVDTRIWKIKYTNLWTRLSDIHGGRTFSERRGKYTAMHALSWNVTRDFNLTFFEMVIWQDSDSMSTRNLDLHYLNPVLFFRPVEYAQGSADNVILCLGFSIKARTKLQVYGKIVLDEFN
ncbi:MAG: gliding motility protein RemB, partial [Bacteroidota bacterium]